jgi:mono/diheme cytochrome c family protein
MIATIAFVLLFVLLGLSIVFVAFGGGATGAREQLLHSQTPLGRKVAFASVAVLVVIFGIALPFVLGVDNADNQSKAAPGGIDLTSAQQHGREVFARNCATCHTLAAAKAVGRVGPNLDQLRPPAVLTLDAIKSGRARGQGQMPAGLIDGQDAKDVASFVAAVAGR